MNHAIDLAVGCHYFLSGLRSVHQMALPVNGSTHLIPALLLIYRPRKDERLSWPSWLIYSGWLTHISGHPSAAGRAQERESSPVRDRRSTTVLRHQLAYTVLKGNYDTSENQVTSVRNFVLKSGRKKISLRQVGGVVDKTRRRSSLLITPMMVDASWPEAHRLAYYTSVDYNPLTPLLRFVADLLYNLLL